MILIGLCGAAGSGKGSAAKRLVDGYGYLELAFADPIYQAVSAITGMSVPLMKKRSNKEAPLPHCGGKSPRELLQLLGTEFGRGMIHEDIWVMRTMRTVALARKEGAEGCVITDVRFDNEAVAIREEGGFILEITRPGAGCLTGGAASHSSEAGIGREHIFATIRNDGTLADLDAAVDAAVSGLHADIM